MCYLSYYLTIGGVMSLVVYAALKGSGQTEIKYPFIISVLCIFIWPIPLCELLYGMIKRK